MHKPWVLGLTTVVMMGLGVRLYQWSVTAVRVVQLRRFLAQAEALDAWRIPAGTRCNAAPFLWPTTGYPGFLRGDAWSLTHWHTGVDIFSGKAPGEEPVYAVYPGLLYRLPHWKATVAIRHRDPLHPGRFIWTYYTHMADAQGRSFIAEAFPPGTEGVPVEAGTLLGYQGNFSGVPGRPVGVHLHFSVVLDGEDILRNEARPWNTLDPSPYLGVPLSAFRLDVWPRPRCAR